MSGSGIGFPPSATMFFCIGAQKAGTSWLHALLARAPGVHFSRNKELHYFDVMAGAGAGTLGMRVDIARTLAGKLKARTGPGNRAALTQLRELCELLEIYTGPDKGPARHDAYLSYLLQGWSGQPVVGDITPAYAVLTRRHFAEMADIGRARFLFVMRDPVARMWSQIRMAASMELGADAGAGPLGDACRARAEDLARSGRLPRVERADYIRTMTELEAAVPAERILYCFYEDLFTPGTIARICGFLGIEPVAPEGPEPVNPGRDIPLPGDLDELLRVGLSRQYRTIRARFGDAVPAAWAG